MDNRRFVLLRAAPGLTRRQMVEHWRTIHATVIVNLPVFWEYTSRYIQNYVVENSPSFAAAFPFDGVVETWQRPRIDKTRLFANEPVYHDVVRVDERKAFDMTKTVALLTEVNEVIVGPERGVKLLSFVRRRAESNHHTFLDWWLERQGGLVKQSPQFLKGLICYQQCHCMPELERGFADGRPLHGFDGVGELRFESREALEAAFSSDDYLTAIAPAEARNIAAVMHVLVEQADIPRPSAKQGVIIQ